MKRHVKKEVDSNENDSIAEQWVNLVLAHLEAKKQVHKEQKKIALISPNTNGIRA